MKSKHIAKNADISKTFSDPKWLNNSHTKFVAVMLVGGREGGDVE